MPLGAAFPHRPLIAELPRVLTADDREQVSTRPPLPLGRDKARGLAVRFLICRVAERDGSRSDRGADGNHPPPAPTERRVRISRFFATPAVCSRLRCCSLLLAAVRPAPAARCAGARGGVGGRQGGAADRGKGRLI